jgi:hypothetical protein
LHTITAIRLSLWSCLTASRRNGREIVRERSRHVGMKLMASLKERTIVGADRKWTSSPASERQRERERRTP